MKPSAIIIAVIIVGALIGAALMVFNQPSHPNITLNNEDIITYDINPHGDSDPCHWIGQLITTITIDAPEVINLAAAKDGSIYVAATQQIRQYTPKGVLKGRVELDITPRCLAVAEIETEHAPTSNEPTAPSAESIIYFAAETGLYRCVHNNDTAQTQITRRDKPSETFIPTSLAYHKGRLFIADAGSKAVWTTTWDTDEKIRRILPNDNQKRGHFVVPSPAFDLAMTSDNQDPELAQAELWVVNPGRHRLERCTAQGETISMWGSFGSDQDGFCGCCNPVAIAPTADGYIVTAEKGIKRVKLYDQLGCFMGVIAGHAFFQHNNTPAKTSSERFLDLAPGILGTIWVLDPQTKNLYQFALEK